MLAFYFVSDWYLQEFISIFNHPHIFSWNIALISVERIHTEDGSGDYTIFNRVTYLGAASINAPRSEGEIQRNMAILNAQAQEQALEVSVSVPSNSEGYVMWVLLHSPLLNKGFSEVKMVEIYGRKLGCR